MAFTTFEKERYFFGENAFL